MEGREEEQAGEAGRALVLEEDEVWGFGGWECSGGAAGTWVWRNELRYTWRMGRSGAVMHGVRLVGIEDWEEEEDDDDDEEDEAAQDRGMDGWMHRTQN